MMDYNTMTKDLALDTLVSRIKKRFPGVDASVERAILNKYSRAVLLHSVGAQWYGDLGEVDDGLMRYAYGQMTPEEQRIIDHAG